jgi:hexosaminidase
MTPGAFCYFDHSQSKNEDSVTIGGYLPLEKVYGYEPIPPVLNAAQAKHIMGAQANLWTEYIGNPSKVEYMIFPRMMALSEVLWSPKAKRNWKDFEKRLSVILDRLDKKKVNYSKAFYDLQATVMPTEDYDGVMWKVESKTENSKIVWMPSFFSSSLFDYTKPIVIKETSKGVTASLLNNNGARLSTVSQSFLFNKATGKKITLVNPPSNNYPGDGAFTLVNGVQNEQGLSKGNEFLGFLGKDCEGSIDLGSTKKIKIIRFHCLNQNGSWIYPPKNIEISFGNDTNKKIMIVEKPVEDKQGNILYEINLEHETELSVLNFKLVNFGIIPSGNPGAGTAAWLFVDEIEVE